MTSKALILALLAFVLVMFSFFSLITSLVCNTFGYNSPQQNPIQQHVSTISKSNFLDFFQF